jgi:hypothetical protein
MFSKLTVTQASVTALFVSAVGVVCSVVTPLSGEKSAILAAGSLVIAAVFAVVHLIEAIHASKVKVTLTDLEDGVRALAKDEIGKVNLSAVAEDVVSAHGLSDISGLVKQELNKILVATGLEQAKATAVLPVEAPAPVTDPAVVPAPPAA